MEFFDHFFFGEFGELLRLVINIVLVNRVVRMILPPISGKLFEYISEINFVPVSGAVHDV